MFEGLVRTTGTQAVTDSPRKVSHASQRVTVSLFVGDIVVQDHVYV